MAALVAVALLAGCGAAAGPGRGGPPPGSRYYLALGDSLARGVQPGPAGISRPTPDGYPAQLAALLRRRDPGLRLADLGCPGETTATMRHGGHCRYPAGSQLAAAVRFLRARPGRVSLITIDIGANDPHSCFTLPEPVWLARCPGGAEPGTVANLRAILGRLRRAAGPGVPIIGMSYYVPGLAVWRQGPAGRALARRAERLAAGFDARLAAVYPRFGARVADVAGAFRTADFRPAGFRAADYRPAGSPAAGFPAGGLRRADNRGGSSAADFLAADLRPAGFPAAGFRPADVRGDGSAAPRGARSPGLPANVAAICRWTWNCAGPPRGPNKHPNPAGYTVIARALLRDIPPLRAGAAGRAG